MAKLVKKKYYTSTGETKINNYLIYISKEVVQQANITDEDKLKIYSKDNKIIIEKEV